MGNKSRGQSVITNDELNITYQWFLNSWSFSVQRKASDKGLQKMKQEPQDQISYGPFFGLGFSLGVFLNLFGSNI